MKKTQLTQSLLDEDEGLLDDPARIAALAQRLAELQEDQPLTAHAGRKTLRDKLLAGLHGLKHAIRGDSSFFAHGYRALLIGLIAAQLGVNAYSWCMLVLGFGLVLTAELAHSAIDTLARVVGDPDEPHLLMAREIAAAGVLVAVFVSASVSITILLLKFGSQLGWWA